MANVTVKMADVDGTSGDPNLIELANDANRKGATRYPVGDSVSYEIFDEFLGVSTAEHVVSKSGEVTDYPLFIEIASGDDLVPIGVTGDMGVDEEGVEFNRTWSQWLAPHSYITERDGRKFVGTSSCVEYPQGYLPMSGLVPVFGSLLKPSELPAPPDIDV